MISLMGIEIALVLFAQAIGAVVGTALAFLRLDRWYRDREAKVEERYTRALLKAETRAEQAEERAKARIDFVMELLRSNEDDDTQSAASNDYQILEVLMNHFDEEGLKLIAFEMGIRYDALTGQSAPTKAMSLVTAARQRNLIAQLIRIMRRERPEVMK